MIDSTWLPVVHTPKRPSEIVPGVWVGDRIDARAAWRLKDWTVIDVREMDTTLDPPQVVRIPLLRNDTRGMAGRKALGQIADAIDAELAKGQQVLVHCWQGMERSPLSVAAWLVLRRGHTLDEAYQRLQDRRGVYDRRAWLTRKARRILEGA